MIPKVSQLNLGTQPRYTKQYGSYNASTGSTGLFGHIASVFSKSANAERDLVNQLRLRAGTQILDNQIALDLGTEGTRRSKMVREHFGEDLTDYDPMTGRMRFSDKRPSVIHNITSGGKHDISEIIYNKNYDDRTPPSDDDDSNPPNPPSGGSPAPAPRRTRTTKTTTSKGTKTTIVEDDAPKTSKKTKSVTVPTKPKNPAEPSDTPTTTVTANPKTKKTRTTRPGREGAIAEDPNANAKRKTKSTKPDDKTIQ